MRHHIHKSVTRTKRIKKKDDAKATWEALLEREAKKMATLHYEWLVERMAAWNAYWARRRAEAEKPVQLATRRLDAN